MIFTYLVRCQLCARNPFTAAGIRPERIGTGVLTRSMSIPQKTLIPVNAVPAVRSHLESGRAEALERAWLVVANPETTPISHQALINVRAGSVLELVAGIARTNDRGQLSIRVHRADLFAFATFRLMKASWRPESRLASLRQDRQDK